jgi:hypothetical protein
MDVIPGVSSLLPSYCVTFPSSAVDGALAEQTRHKFYDMASADKVRIQGYHFPFPAVGNIEKDGNGYRWVPAAWNPTI